MTTHEQHSYRRYYGIGIPALTIGLTVIFATLPPSWWPTMPTLLVYIIVIAGIELSVLGLGAMFAGFCTQKRTGERYLSIVGWIKQVWSGALLPVCAIFVLAVGPLSWSYIDYSAGGISLDFEYPSDLDFALGSVRLTYLIQNDTDHPMTISDLRLVTFSTDAKIYAPYAPLKLCTDASAVHITEIGETINPAGSEPVKVSGPGFDSSSHVAASFTVNGGENQRVYTIEAHRGAEIQTAIKIAPEDFTKWNTQVICPGLKLFGGRYGRREVLCAGAERTYFPLTEMRDRQGQLLNSYSNFTHRSDEQGFGLIYAHPIRTMWISDSRNHMFCREN